MREGRSLGCYLPAYPSALGGELFLQHMHTMHRFSRELPKPLQLQPRHEAQASAGAEAEVRGAAAYTACVSRDAQRCGRDATDEGEADGGAVDAPAAQDSGWCGFEPEGRIEMHNLLQELLSPTDPASAWQAPYKAQCERMLGGVPDVPKGAWARRTHIFREISEVTL